VKTAKLHVNLLVFENFESNMPIEKVFTNTRGPYSITGAPGLCSMSTLGNRL